MLPNIGVTNSRAKKFIELPACSNKAQKQALATNRMIIAT